MPATKDQNKVIAKKLQVLEIYNAKLKERGLEEDRSLEPTLVLSASKAHKLAIFLKNIDREDEAERSVFWSWLWLRCRIGLDPRYISSSTTTLRI